MYSLNQINDALKTTAESLSQVKKYLGLMDDWEVNAEHSKQYLLVSASIEPSVLNYSGTSIDYVIQLTVVDRVKHGNSNSVEVLSDTAIIYNDIVAKLKKDYRNEFILSGDVQIEDVILMLTWCRHSTKYILSNNLRIVPHQSLLFLQPHLNFRRH